MALVLPQTAMSATIISGSLDIFNGGNGPTFSDPTLVTGVSAGASDARSFVFQPSAAFDLGAGDTFAAVPGISTGFTASSTTLDLDVNANFKATFEAETTYARTFTLDLAPGATGPLTVTIPYEMTYQFLDLESGAWEFTASFDADLWYWSGGTKVHETNGYLFETIDLFDQGQSSALTLTIDDVSGISQLTLDISALVSITGNIDAVPLPGAALLLGSGLLGLIGFRRSRKA